MSSNLASDPFLSAWVAANAGAGKTYTLANRVARLLLADARPEKILCLTFTKAAAAEMQHRLFRQLGEWAMLPDGKLADNIRDIGAEPNDLPKARRLFAQALETPGGLKVLTLHAFCQIVLARFPIEADVSPGFEVLDDASARALIGEARQIVLERAGTGDAPLHEAVALLATEAGEARLGDILHAALGNDRRKMDRFFDGLDGTPFEDAIWRAHGAERGADPAENFCRALRSEIEQLRAVRAWLHQGTKQDTDSAGRLAKILATDLSADSFALFREWLMTKDGAPRKKLAAKALADARPDLLSYLSDLQDRFCKAEDRQRAARAARLAQAALTLIDAMRREYAAAKTRRAVLDYDDLIVKTLALLERGNAAQWVLYKLDNGIDHILIDEAQDTSPEQWAIVRKLTEEFFAGTGRERKLARTIFAVGDEKQSIFSFQGADPTQFDINRNYFEQLATQAEQPFLDQPLVTSRRSAPEILQFVDHVFFDAAARAGLTSRDQAITHLAHRAEAMGGIEFWTALAPPPAVTVDPYLPVDAVQPDSPIVELARRIAGQIRTWLDAGATLPGHDKPIAPGDIMILLPRREPFGGEIIRQLKLRRIPVAGADRIVLTEQIAVMDLMALGRFVLQREDDLNLAALLRSPLCSIGEEDLFVLCHGRAGTVWQSLSDQKSQARFEAAHVFLSEMLARADYAPPFEFYSHALTTLDKKRDLIARLGPESTDAIEEFVSLALAYERMHTPSLEGFLDWVARGDTEIKRDMERGRNEVRVMTVHGAKGLEADIVILPDTTALPDPPSRKGHLLYGEASVLFPLAESEAPESVKAAKRIEEDQTLREHRRLLYVALTRARDRLYVCGFENRRGVRDGSWYALARAAAEALGRPITRHGEAASAFGHVENETRKTETGMAPAQTPLPGWAMRPAPPDRIAPRLIRPSDALDMPEQTSLSPLRATTDRFKRGNVVHALLARLPDIAPDARRGLAIQYAVAQGFDEDAAAALADETLRLLDDPEFAPVFSPTSRAEVAFLAALPELGPGAQVNGRVDRLAITDTEVLILDFKTNRPPPSREEDVSPIYLAQMAVYRAAAARIFPDRRIVCGLVWTDGPSLMRLSDLLLDRQMARIRQRLDPEGVHS
ncbi:MAG: double-strand break repair helicase AddA [Alphaproteobacteria bacterium]|nr:double-strand break repair helicase AddA [Alphaproteobacteria bacterium]